MTKKQSKNPQEYNFKNKHALLDTNILSVLLNPDSKSSVKFKEVFDFLEEQQAFPYVINRITAFEFCGYSTNKEVFTLRQNWISQFDGLPPDISDYETATKLSSMYKCVSRNINPKQISIVDCLYAANLIRVNSQKDRAFIVTSDINDYPSFLFDMPKVFPIESNDGATSFVGIKTLNKDKLKKLEERFDKSNSI